MSRLASLSKLDSKKECSTGNTSHTTTCKPDSNKNLTKNNKIYRDTVFIDQQLNVHEILNDKKILLLTEDNFLEKSDISKDDPLLKLSEKKEEIPGSNNYQNLSFSLDEQLENVSENNFPNELKLSNKFDTFNKKLNIKNKDAPLANKLKKNAINTNKFGATY